MRKIGFLASIFTVILALLVPTLKTDAASATFTDVPEDFWAADQIQRFTDQGIIQGYGDGTYRPNQPITRGQAAIVLAGGLELDTENPSSIDYQDLHKEHYAYDAIATITNEGIMNGYNGKFTPDKPLTRAQMAVLLTNAFGFEGDQNAPFEDVSEDLYAYEAINAIFENGVTSGYEDDTFRPTNATTRAEFAAFLAKAINNDESLSVTDLLKEAYANEQTIDSYEFESSMNLGLTLPESVQSNPEGAMVSQMLKDIQVDISGSYQKDPMMMEATVDLTMQGDMKTTISLPMVMTEDKMWIKPPQTPFAPLPEEVDGKFIEYDLEELAKLEGQPTPTPTMDLDLQTELALALNNLFLDHFGEDFYDGVETDSIEVPSEVNAEHVVKFELTNEKVQPFVETFLTGYLPQFFELLENPEYAEALGLTAEDIELAKGEIEAVQSNIDEIVAQINNTLEIHTFEEYVAINQDHLIAYNVLDLNVDITAEEETFGFQMSFDQQKLNINEEVSIEAPSDSNVIPFQELMKLEEELGELAPEPTL